MGWTDQAWKDHVVKPIEAAGGVVSSEFKNATSGGLDFGVWANKQFRGAGRSAAEGAASVIRGEIDYVFDEKLNPYTDKLDGILSARIAQAQTAGQTVIKDAAAEFSGLLAQGRGHIEGILVGVVDPMIKDNLRRALDMVNQALAEIVLALRGLLNEIDVYLEKYIREIFTMAMSLLAQLRAIVGEAIADVRKQIVEPAFEKLDKLESKFFQDLGEVIEKLGEPVSAVEKEFDLWRQRLTELLLPLPKNWSCYKKTGIELQIGPSLSDMEVYRLSECLRLTEIEDNLAHILPTRIRDLYVQLEGDAWLLACKYRKQGGAARGILLSDWAKYGHLARLWDGYAQ
jgi:hypothetical protein